MDERTQLILTRAKELLARDHPVTGWIGDTDRLDAGTIERQATYLALAEHQLLDEGRPLISEADRALLLERYRIRATFGDQSAETARFAWRGNRLQVWVLERRTAEDPPATR